MRLPKMQRVNVSGVTRNILTLSAVPLAFFVILLVTGSMIMRGDRQNAQIAAAVAERLTASDGIYAALDAQSQAIQHLRKTHSAADLEKFRAQRGALDEQTVTLDRLMHGDAANAAIYRSYRGDTPWVEALLVQFLSAVVDRNAKAASHIETSPQIAARLRRWHDEKGAFDEAERREMLSAYARSSQVLNPFRQATFAAIVIGAIATLVAGAFVGGRLALRLRRLGANARNYAAGEPAPPLEGADEVAQLDATLRELTARLRAVADEREAALASYEREHNIAATLQHALLPDDLPSLPGLHVYTAYVAADDVAAVGGDWYDVFRLDNGLIGISAGDVAGHGVQAATRMAAVRQSIRTAARATDDPAIVLRHVNRVLLGERYDGFVSTIFATVDMESGLFRYAVAGHPAPVILGPGEHAMALPDGGTVLGVDENPTFESREMRLAAGSAMLIYTDGLIEHKRDLLGGIEEMMAAARAEFRNPSRNPADGVQRRVLNGQAPPDDSAVLFMYFDQFGPRAPERREWSFDARDEAAATRVKRAFLRCVKDARPGYDVGLAEMIYGELIGNVVRHTPGYADVVLEQDRSTFVLSVCDRGAPFATPHGRGEEEFAESGRGMFLVHSLAGNLTIERTHEGNCVRVALPPSTDRDAVADANGRRVEGLVFG